MRKTKCLLPLAMGTFGLGLTEFVMMGILPDTAKSFSISIPAGRTLYFIVRTWRRFRLNFARDFWQNKTVKKYFNSSCFCFHSRKSFSCIFSKLSVIMCIKVYCRIAAWCFFRCWRYCCRKTCR